MVMETSLDKFGRVIIPKGIRTEIGLEPGAILRIEQDGERILLEPLQDEPVLVEKEGVLVFRGKATEDISAAVRGHRERHLKRLGL
jgi:AbrB family looped-hinge helix DNA binding protein